jgi:BirA family biotin operon repressor/biotin-[acetyl-CoA-carboxylase] ligase
VTDASPATAFLSRVERFERVGSTNDIVRGWLTSGTPEICLATADEQTAGRGRHARAWQAPAGAALLASIGFRPDWLAPDRTWRLAAIVSLAMCDAAEDVAGLPVGSIQLKWPNDLVIEKRGPHALLIGAVDAADAAARLAGPLELRKLAGVLGESEGLGTPDVRVVVGIGINAGWDPADFPADLAPTMTSLRAASGGRPIDRQVLLDGFIERLEGRVEALRAGYFDIATWTGRQATTGRLVALEGYERSADEPLVAAGVDATTGALVVQHQAASGAPWLVHAGEVVRVRLRPAGV